MPHSVDKLSEKDSEPLSVENHLSVSPMAFYGFSVDCFLIETFYGLLSVDFYDS